MRPDLRCETKCERFLQGEPLREMGPYVYEETNDLP